MSRIPTPDNPCFTDIGTVEPIRQGVCECPCRREPNSSRMGALLKTTTAKERRMLIRELSPQQREKFAAECPYRTSS
jgi:hypothetical protein